CAASKDAGIVSDAAPKPAALKKSRRFIKSSFYKNVKPPAKYSYFTKVLFVLRRLFQTAIH
ncbi:MAG: hypothetical protein ACYTEO_14340, partial [Planctomycetota bacterium]